MCSFFPSYYFRLSFRDQRPSPFFPPSPRMYCSKLLSHILPTVAHGGQNKLVKCEYLTNQQITCWQGGMQKGYFNLAEGFFLREGGPHFQFHRHPLTFKDISAPLIFDQAAHNAVVHMHMRTQPQPCGNEFTNNCDRYVRVANMVSFSQPTPLPLGARTNQEEISSNVGHRNPDWHSTSANTAKLTSAVRSKCCTRSCLSTTPLHLSRN